MKNDRQARWVLVSIMTLAAIAGLWVLARWNPADYSFFPRCAFYTVSGWHCPGCGTQRAIHQMLHGKFVDAFFLNPLATLVAPVLACCFMVTAVYRLRGKTGPCVYIRSRWIWLLAYSVIAFWLLRNLPLSPFIYFAPNG